MDSIMALYEHPITKEVGEKARKVGGHGGMDFIMDYRLVYCLQKGYLWIRMCMMQLSGLA